MKTKKLRLLNSIISLTIASLAAVVILGYSYNTDFVYAQSCPHNFSGYLGHYHHCNDNQYCNSGQCENLPYGLTATSLFNSKVLYCTGPGKSNPPPIPNEHILETRGPADKCMQVNDGFNEHQTSCIKLTGVGNPEFRDWTAVFYHKYPHNHSQYPNWRSNAHYTLIQADSPRCNDFCRRTVVDEWSQCVDGFQHATSRRVIDNTMLKSDPSCVNEELIRACSDDQPVDDNGDNGGDNGNDTVTIDFNNLSCQVTTPTTIPPYQTGQDITLTAYPFAASATYDWGGSFIQEGEGGVSTGHMVTRSFDEPGTYVANLTVSYDGMTYPSDGSSVSCVTDLGSEDIQVLNIPTLEFSISPNIASDGFCQANWAISGGNASCSIITEFDEIVHSFGEINEDMDGVYNVPAGNQYRLQCVTAGEDSLTITSDAQRCIDPNLQQI